MVAGVRVGGGDDGDDGGGVAHGEGGGLPAEPFRWRLARYARAIAPPRPAVAKVAGGW